MPLVTDFGLAKRVESDSELTQSGVLVGTPSYMAPEQTLGKKSGITMVTDVYGLGAVFYAILTSRPPFRGETVLDTLTLVREGEVDPPRRLNPRLDRDLEAVCLACLRKDSAQRYISALALAEDLERWLHGEPTRARPAGMSRRIIHWVRRRPGRTAFAVAAILAIIVGVTGAGWFERQRVERQTIETRRQEELRVGVEAALAEESRLLEQSRFSLAKVALDQANSRLGEDGPEVLRQRVAESRRNLDLAMELDAIQVLKSHLKQDSIDYEHAEQVYEDIFVRWGFGRFGEDSSAVAARLIVSPIRPLLVAALDDWALCAHQQGRNERAEWALRVNRQVDPDPWRDQLRDPAILSNDAAVLQLLKKCHG